MPHYTRKEGIITIFKRSKELLHKLKKANGITPADFFDL